MSFVTANAGPITPDEVAELVVKPVTTTALPTTLGTVVSTASTTLRIPIVDTDAAAAWTAEAQEITESQPTLDELTVTPAKLAALVPISREVATDTSPAAADIVGDSIKRALVSALDTAWLAAATTNGPAGLPSIAASEDVVTGDTWTNFDWAAEAESLAATSGGQITAYVVHPVDALTLRGLRESTTSNRTLLAPDPTVPGRLAVGGIPLVVTPKATQGVIWGISRADALTVMREDVELATDESVWFTSDRVAVRATMRVGFAFPVPGRIVRVALSA